MSELNFKPNTLWTNDNLPVMRGINSECVDLIYLDPPFNSNADYAAPIGSEAAGAEFKDTWTLSDIDVEWLNLLDQKHPKVALTVQVASDNSMKSYLCYMTIRLLEMKRILKPTGAIYLHCDPTASHYLKTVMDGIFGRKNFRREVNWANQDQSGYKSQARNWIRGGDTILYYTKSGEYTFNKEYLPHKPQTIKRYDKVDSDDRRYKIYRARDGSERRKYLKEDGGAAVSSVWTDILGFQTRSTAKEYVGYPTQKPLKLLERIINASSNAGDLVLDPFCGCATAPIAAQKCHRNYVGIDISEKTRELIRFRSKNELGLFWDGIERDDIPLRTDLGKLPEPRSHLNEMYGEQDGKCNGCGVHFPKANFHVDHIIAKNKGGTNYRENLQLLCNRCNSIKGNRGMEYLKAKLRFD